MTAHCHVKGDMDSLDETGFRAVMIRNVIEDKKIEQLKFPPHYEYYPFISNMGRYFISIPSQEFYRETWQVKCHNAS